MKLIFAQTDAARRKIPNGEWIVDVWIDESTGGSCGENRAEWKKVDSFKLRDMVTAAGNLARGQNRVIL